MISKTELIEALEYLKDSGDIQFQEINKIDMVERYLNPNRKSCKTCRYGDGWRCNHSQGCETEGNYELWEPLKQSV